jgi:hypothetical protein
MSVFRRGLLMAAAIHNSGGKVQQNKLDTYLALPCLALPCLTLLYLTLPTDRKKRKEIWVFTFPYPTTSKGATPTAATPQTCSKIQKSVGNV